MIENSIDIPPEGIKFLEGLLELDPNKRLSSEAAIKLPFVVKYHDEHDEPTCEPFVDTIDATELSTKEWKRKQTFISNIFFFEKCLVDSLITMPLRRNRISVFKSLQAEI